MARKGIALEINGHEYEFKDVDAQNQITGLRSDLTGAGIIFTDLTYTYGYISRTGEVHTENTHYKYSDPIPMKKGETIYVYTESATGNVSVISKYYNGTYTKIREAKSNDYYTYIYTAEEDISIVVCVKRDNAFYVYGNKFSDLQKMASESFSVVDTITETSKNLFIISKATVGQFIAYNTSTGDRTVTENSQWMTEEVPVEAGATYTFTHISYFHYWLDSSGNFISRIGSGQTQTDVTSVAPSGAAKILLNVRVSTQNSFMMVKGSVLPASYSEGFVSPRVKREYIEQIDEDNVYYVGRGGSGDHDFADPISCFYAIQDLKAKKKVIIYPGTYDLYQLMGGDEYFEDIDPDTQTYYEVQPWLSDIEIVGFGKVVLQLNMNPDLPSNVRRYFSPLNVRGNAIVRNIQIDCSYCRYCIHDESGNNFPYSERLFENLICNISGGEQAIGSGYSANSTVTVRNCYLKSGTSFAFSCHTKGGTNLTCENTVFKTANSSYPAMKVSQESNQFSFVKIDSCIFITEFASQLRLSGEYDYYENKIGKTRVDIFNSNITSVETSTAPNPYASFEEEVTKYDTVAGTVTVLVSTT